MLTGSLWGLAAGVLVFAVIAWPVGTPSQRLRDLRGGQPAAVSGTGPRRSAAGEVFSTVWQSLRRRRARDPDDDALLFVTVLASLARGGVDVPRSMEFLAGQFGERPLGAAAGAAAATGAAGGSVADALADVPSLTALRRTLAVTEQTGAPLSDTLTCLAEGMADDLDSARAVESALAGPRATSGVLTLLPLVGLGLGTALGADPFTTLVGTTLGRGCLVAGAALAASGWWWSRRLIRAATR